MAYCVGNGIRVSQPLGYAGWGRSGNVEVVD
jgi:hypothetical protein